MSRRGPILTEFVKEVFSGVDVIATPTVPMYLPTLAETDIDNGPGDAHAKSLKLLANTEVFNVNCGLDPNGLPIGISFTGRPFAEATVLKVADAFQRETDWHKRRPPIVA